MRFCLNCKKEISETAHFCSNVCKAEYVVSAFDKHLGNARERLKERFQKEKERLRKFKENTNV